MTKGEKRERAGIPRGVGEEVDKRSQWQMTRGGQGRDAEGTWKMEACRMNAARWERLKTRKGIVARNAKKARKRERKGEARGKSYMSTSRISVKIIALSQYYYFQLPLVRIKWSSDADRLLVYFFNSKIGLGLSTIVLYVFYTWIGRLWKAR